MRSFNLPVYSWRSWFDVDVTDAFIFHMPMKLCLEFVAIICANSLNAKRKLLNHESEWQHQWLCIGNA